MIFTVEEKKRFVQRGMKKPGVALYMYSPDEKEFLQVFEQYKKEYYTNHFHEIQPFFSLIYRHMDDKECAQIDELIYQFSCGNYDGYVEWANKSFPNSFATFTLDDMPCPKYDRNRINNPQELAALYGGKFDRSQRKEAEAFVREQLGPEFPLRFEPYRVIFGKKLIQIPHGHGMQTNALDYPFSKAKWLKHVRDAQEASAVVRRHTIDELRQLIKSFRGS